MNKPIRQVWTFTSDSNASVEYQTLQYIDQTTSCNCKGWTRRTVANGSRSCKHTRWVDLGMADRHCTATRNYDITPTPSENNAQKQIQRRPKLGERKFAVQPEP